MVSVIIVINLVIGLASAKRKKYAELKAGSTEHVPSKACFSWINSASSPLHGLHPHLILAARADHRAELQIILFLALFLSASHSELPVVKLMIDKP